MNPKPNHLPTDHTIPTVKVKNSISRKRIFASVLLSMIIASLATIALMLLLALMFAPQLSNALWNTDVTQQALYGTSAAVQNAQIIVDITSTALLIQARDHQNLLENLTEREGLLDAREADLSATDDAITAAIIATQTADVLVNEQQRTQAAVHYSETQSSINQQSTVIAIEATSTQLALDTRPQPTPTQDIRPFDLKEEATYKPYSIMNCNWQGIAGTVYDVQNTPLDDANLQIRVLGADTDNVVKVGDNLGLKGYNWAIKLGDQVTNDTYFLRLEDLEGNAQSPMVRLTYDSSCEKNLAVVNFIQMAELND